MAENKEYYAFISYKREDEKWAKWLAHKLESYRLPTILNGKELPKNLRPVFRDTDELSAGNLPKQLYHALSISKNLIVICSPKSALSEWVNKEITDFIEIKGGKSDNIYPFIIEGTPFSKDAEKECFPAALLNLPDNEERLGGNINEQGGRDAAMVKIISGMLGVSFDSLWQKHERTQKRKRWAIVVASLLFALVCLGIVGYIVSQNIKLDEANKQIAEERDRANSERDRAERANASLLVANDSIRMQKDRVSQINEELVNTNELLTTERDNVLRANWKIKENLSRFVAENGEQLIKEGDSYMARFLAINILPKDLENPDKPYTLEAERMLRKALVRDDVVLRGHTDYVYHASFSPDGSMIVSASADKTIRIWDVKTKTQIGEPLIGHNSFVTSASFSPDGTKIVSCGDKTIRIWDVRTRTQIGTLVGHTYSVYSVSFSPDGSKIVSGSLDNTIRIWDVRTRTQIGVLVGHTSSVNSVSFSPDGTKIVSGSTDKTLRIWNARTKKQIGEPLVGHEGGVLSVSFSPDGKKIISASSDNTMRIWDSETGSQIGYPLVGHSGPVLTASFSPDGRRIVSASKDQTIRIKNAETGATIKRLIGHTQFGIKSVSFSPDGKSLVLASADNNIRIWGLDENAWKMKKQYDVYNKYKSHIASFSPDGTKIISINTDINNIINVLDAETGEMISSVKENHVQFNSDYKTFITVSSDNTIKIWNCNTLKQIGSIQNRHIADVSSVSLSSDGKRLVSVSGNGEVRIWDAITNKQLGILPRNKSGGVLDASFNPCDDGILITAAVDSTIQMWNVKTGQPICLFKSKGGIWPGSYSFSSDGKFFVYPSMDNSIRILDTETGDIIGEPLIGHTGAVTSISFSPDGMKIISASLDETVRIWDLETKQQFVEPIKHNGMVYSASFSSDGKSIISASDEGRIHIWEYPSLQELINQTREKFKNRQLSPEERRKYYLE